MVTNPKSPAYLAFENSAIMEDIRTFFICAEEAPVLAIDTETTLDDLRDGRGWTQGVSIAFRLPILGVVSNYFPFRHETGNLDKSVLFALKTLVEKAPVVVFHHAKFDLVALAQLGIVPRGKVYCTLVMSHMINENEPVTGKGLDSLTKYYLNDPGKKKSEDFKAAIKLFGWNRMPPIIMHEYAAYDTDLTLRLFEYLQLEWDVQDLEQLWEKEEAFIKLLVKMEGRGVRINQSLIAAEIDRGQARMGAISRELGLNPASPKDLYKLIIEDLNLPVIKETPGGKASFDKGAMIEYEALMAAMDDPRASLILEYRGYQKTVSSNYLPYRDLLSPDGRLRPNYKMHGTVTGRLSCEKPNLQQIPRVSNKPWNGSLKQAFIPEPGYTLYEADYAQLELRLGAAYANEVELIEAFNSGRDVFSEMATEFNMLRQDCKTLTYTIQYGGGAKRISAVFNVDLMKAVEIKDNYFDKYAGFATATKAASTKCKQQGFLRLWTNRRRHFNDPKNEAHKAFNSVIQGGAAEIVKHTMLRLEKEVDNYDCRMLLQVHDSVLFEIKHGTEDHYLPLIKQVMEAVEPDFGVHFAVEVKEWGK